MTIANSPSGLAIGHDVPSSVSANSDASRPPAPSSSSAFRSSNPLVEAARTVFYDLVAARSTIQTELNAKRLTRASGPEVESLKSDMRDLETEIQAQKEIIQTLEAVSSPVPVSLTTEVQHEPLPNHAKNLLAAVAKLPLFRTESANKSTTSSAISIDDPIRFIKKFENTAQLYLPNPSPELWTLALLQRFGKQIDETWAEDAISRSTPWPKAKEIFLHHFCGDSYVVGLLTELMRLHPKKGQSIADFGTRFLSQTQNLQKYTLENVFVALLMERLSSHPAAQSLIAEFCRENPASSYQELIEFTISNMTIFMVNEGRVHYEPSSVECGYCNSKGIKNSHPESECLRKKRELANLNTATYREPDEVSSDDEPNLNDYRQMRMLSTLINNASESVSESGGE